MLKKSLMFSKLTLLDDKMTIYEKEEIILYLIAKCCISDNLNLVKNATMFFCKKMLK